MQNYEQIFKELGIEIPEDKKSALKQKMDENYRTKSDYDKAIQKRDEYKTSLDDVQEKLDGFKDVNVDDLKGQIATLTTQLNDEKTARAADAKKVEIEKMVTKFLAETDEKGEKLYEFANPITENYYRDQLLQELDSDSAKGKSITEIFQKMITDEKGNQIPNILVDKVQKQAQKNAVQFTTSFQKGSGTGGAITKEDFRKMNLDERLKLKQTDPDLYAALSK